MDERPVTTFAGEVLGGPSAYSEGHGDHPHMIRKHLGRAVAEPQRGRWIERLLDCADEVGAPMDPEFRSAFVAYVEWGSRLAVINSQPGAEELGAMLKDEMERVSQLAVPLEVDIGIADNWADA